MTKPFAEMFQRPRVVIAVIVALTVACYWSALASPNYLYDDEDLFFHTTSLWDDPAGVWRIWAGELHRNDMHYRPVSDTVLWAGHQLWGENVIGYRLLNLTLHLCTVWLAIGVFRHLKLPRPEWIGLFIALHPICVQPVVWMIQARGLLSNLFVIVAIGALVRQHLAQSWRWGVMGLLCLTLALLSKTTAASCPLLVVTLVVLFRVRPTWQTWIFIGAALVVTAALVFLDYRITSANGFNPVRFSPEQGRLLYTSASVLQYLRNFMVPFPLGLFYAFDVSGVEWGCAAIVAVSVIGLLATKRSRHAMQLMIVVAAFIVTLAPVMVGHQSWALSLAQDRYQHLGTFIVVPYLGYVVAEVIRSIPWARMVAVAAVGLLGVVLTTVTIRGVVTYANPERLYEASMRTKPGDWRIMGLWLESRMRTGANKWALQAYSRSRQLDPNLRWVGDQFLPQILLRAQRYDEVLPRLPPPGMDNASDAIRAAILLEVPDPKIRDTARGIAVLANLERLWASVLSHGAAVRLPLATLWASADAAVGRFEEAQQRIERALNDPSIDGPGQLRQRIQDDLRARQLSYCNRRIHTSPESQLLWQRLF